MKMKAFLYYLSLACIWIATCFVILCIPAYLFDSRLSTFWQGFALGVAFFVLYMLKPILKKKILGADKSEKS